MTTVVLTIIKQKQKIKQKDPIKERKLKKKISLFC